MANSNNHQVSKRANGLTPADEKLLRSILLKAECIQPCRAYLGGNEREALDALVRDTTARLNPIPVAQLAARADAYFGPLADQFDWGRRALRADERSAQQ